MGAIPNVLPSEAKRGVMIGLACSGRLVPPEMIVSMGVQAPPTQLSVGYFCAKGLPVDKARDFIAKSALEVKSKYLWFVDDDVLVPPNSLRRLVHVLDNNPDVMVCGGIYCTKTDPPAPVVFQEPGLGPFWRWKVGQVFEVHSMGAGCMLINCEVFKHLGEPPYFPWPEEFSNEVNGKANCVSEDVSFCMKVREAGFRVVAHGGVLCDHYDHVTGGIFNLPLDTYPYKEEVNSTKKE